MQKSFIHWKLRGTYEQTSNSIKNSHNVCNTWSQINCGLEYRQLRARIDKYARPKSSLGLKLIQCELFAYRLQSAPRNPQWNDKITMANKISSDESGAWTLSNDLRPSDIHLLKSQIFITEHIQQKTIVCHILSWLTY
jgi:hypothetical protein